MSNPGNLSRHNITCKVESQCITAMPDIIRLCYSRNSEETVYRLRKYQNTNVEEPIAAIEVRETILDDKLMESIVDLIQTRGVTTIQLDDCGAYINQQSTKLAQALGCVRNLRLSEPTFLSQDFLKHLLSSTIQLTNLRIQDDFNNQKIEALVNGLIQNNTIEVLDLSRSRFHSLTMLSDGFKGNKSLRVLKLRSLGLTDEYINMLLQSIKTHPSLEVLDLSFNHCQHLHNLEEIIGNSSTRLSEISLGYQNLWDPTKFEIVNLARALSSNKSVKTLSLARNKLTDSDMVLFVAALKCNDTMESLDLSENFFSDEGITLLAKTIENGRTGIRRISVVKNPFNQAGSKALLKAVETNYNLFHVDIDYSAHYRDEIRYGVALNKVGRQLLLQNVELALWPRILARISQLDFGGSEASTVMKVCDQHVPSYPLNALHFMIRGPALLHGVLFSCS